MPGLLSGSLLRRGGSGEFIDLAGAQPQLPPTDTTSTGYTVVTDGLLRTSYRSSLGNVEFKNAELWSNLTTGTIRILATGTDIISTSTNTGLFVVNGDIGVWGTMNIGKDININGITIGQGYEGINNIVVRGDALPLPNDFETGQSSIAVGHDTLMGIATSYKTIAIGRYALSSGTEISNSIAIGDSALKFAGVYQTLFVATVTNVALSNPVVITAAGHNLTSGTAIKLFNIDGTVELNDVVYYVEPSTSTAANFALYSDVLRTTPINGTGFTPYVSGTTGTVNTLYQQDSNIAIGAGAGELLIDGEDNIFIAHRAARLWTTGSSNIIIGQNTAKFINTGSGIISIGGDNLVDGQDNQVNIGSVFYYDGRGYAYISSEVNLGLGTHAQVTSTGTFSSTSTMTGGLVVVGGIGVYDNAIIGSSATSTSTTTGAVVVYGGIGARGNVYAQSGNPEENYLLYSPKVITTSTAPAGARIGDIWINYTIPAYLQYIKDGTSTFWIQVGAV
jgi:hypothetical protein